MGMRTRKAKNLQTFVFRLRTGSNGVYGASTYEQEGKDLESALIKIFARFKLSGLLPHFSSLEHIGTETAE
jgi:hypothetical protein